MKKKFKHPELFNLLKKKNTFVTHGRKLSEQIDKLEQARNKDGMQIQKIKDQVVPMMEQLITPYLGDFGMLVGARLVEGSKYEVEIEYIDQVEEFKKSLIAKKKEVKNENPTV